jgi:TRAP transporter TAXI family solute receptor
VLENRGFSGPIEVLRSEVASLHNADKLHRGEIDFGYIAANWIGRALRGESPFTQPIDLRMVAPMNAGPMYFITRAGSGVGTVADLRGRRVSVAPRTSGTAQHAAVILGALGIRFEDFTPFYLDFPAGAEALARGEIDAQLQCPIPNAVMTRLDAETDIRVIPYAPGDLEKVLAAAPVYRRTTMRTGALRALREDVDQAAVVNVLVTHARVDPALVETVATAACEGAAELERLNPLYAGMPDLFTPLRSEGARALEFEGVPLHEGARRAYEKAGFLQALPMR